MARVSTMKLVGLRRIVERIVRLQRDEHGAAAALGDQVEAVVEELAEEREPGVERGGKPFVGSDVGQLDVDALELDAVGFEQQVQRSARIREGSVRGIERRLGDRLLRACA